MPASTKMAAMPTEANMVSRNGMASRLKVARIPADLLKTAAHDLRDIVSERCRALAGDKALGGVAHGRALYGSKFGSGLAIGNF